MLHKKWFRRNAVRAAWILSWFHLAPEVAETCCAREGAATAKGNTLQSRSPCEFKLCLARLRTMGQAGQKPPGCRTQGRHGNEIPLCCRLALRKKGGTRHLIHGAPAKIPTKIIPCLACWGNNSGWNLFWVGKTVSKTIWLKIDLGSAAPCGKIL